MRRHALPDDQWELIQSLLPPPKRTGRPRCDARKVVEGCLWNLRTGAPWRDLPKRFGPWKTVYHHFNRWSRDGTWLRLLEALQIRLDAEGHIDWDLWCVDGSSVRAHASAAGARKKGAPPASRKIMHWVARAADSAPKSMWLLTARACH